MVSKLKKVVKRWRDNYYISWLLASSLRAPRLFASRVGLRIEQGVRKNGVTITLPNGKNLSIAKNTGIGIASLLFWHGLDGHEPETSRTLRFFFERAANFVDVGANCGLYSVMGALWNPDLTVVSFEPVPQIFAGLVQNVLLNKVDRRVRCENVALSDRNGPDKLFLPNSENLDVESTGTLVADSWQSRKNSSVIEVETMRFDEYEARHPMRVDLIKIDVEDFEARVLEGMQGTIRRDRPFIVCEVLPRAHKNERTRKIVEELRYQPYWITPVGCIRVSGFECTRSHFTDFLLSPVTTQDVVLDNLDVLWKLRSVNENRRSA